MTLVSESQLSPRLSELTLHTSLLPSDPKVRVLLPDGYATSGRRYPVIYLFHGGLENASAWTTPPGDAVQATAGLPVIVVMPDEGDFGYYTDWFNNGAFGPPLWETYNVDQLVPWIDAKYRTIRDRSARATAGLSLGGGGAVSLAARHPDIYGAAASFSGAVDTNPTAIRSTLDPVAPLIWGSRQAEEVRWRGNDAWDLAANLVHTDVSLYTGDGDPGPAGLQNLEKAVKEGTVNLHNRLTELGIPHYFDAYGPGQHTFTYFNRDLAQWLPHAMRFFAEKHTLPTAFTYASIKPAYTAYDWTVTVKRPALEFSALEVASAERFSVVGSGTATVVTGALYAPGVKYRITTAAAGGSKTDSVTADGNGRLTLPVDLGPANPAQQYTAAADHTTPTGNTAPSAITDPPFYTRGNGSSFYRTQILISRSN
ncbi:hypothetical protein I6A62_19705 [Frankia sp. AgW1.1]|nr:hypothetical protein [Frankia sp. AgW1.1]